MDTKGEKAEPEHDSLLAQFVELNSRSRWYSSQLWQVPFAYLGITGVTTAGLAYSDHKILLPFAFIVAGLFGICVFLHTVGMRDGERRAVENLKNVEKQLNLQLTAEYKPCLYVTTLQAIVVIAFIAYFTAGIYLFCH